jgi:hypothetical protein
MTEAEAEAIMGCPGQPTLMTLRCHGEEWQGEKCTIYLWFRDEDDNTVSGAMETQDGASVKVADNPADHNIFAFVRRVLGR